MDWRSKMEKHVSKKEQVDILLDKIKGMVTKNNVDIMLQLFNWTEIKAKLIFSAEEKKKQVRHAKDQNKKPPKPLQVSRGEVWETHLGLNIGSEQSGTEKNWSRPVLIVQNDHNNKKSPNTIIVPLSKIENRLDKNNNEVSEEELKKIEGSLRPTEVLLRKNDVEEGEKNLSNPSIVLCQNVREINKERLVYRITKIKDKLWLTIDVALKNSLGID